MPPSNFSSPSFPLHPFFPSGRLTAVGMQQHIRLGKQLREKYLFKEMLLDEQCPDLTYRVKTYTSHQDRALMSAQRFVFTSRV